MNKYLVTKYGESIFGVIFARNEQEARLKFILRRFEGEIHKNRDIKKFKVGIITYNLDSITEDWLNMYEVAS